MSESSSKYWSRFVADLEPYVPGEQPKHDRLVKLNTNENPYGPSPEVLKVLRDGVGDALRLYPPSNADALKQAIADYYQLGVDNVFVGNGSDEVLAHVFNALLKHDKPVLFPDITYSFYPVYCGLYDIDVETVPLQADFSISVEAYLRPNGGIIFPNPNAPTGRLMALTEIEQLLQKNTDSVVVVDEAYIDFGGSSAIPLTVKYPNLLVIQTLSKSRSLAGLRVGFAVGSPGLVEALERVKNSFNSYPLGQLDIFAGVAAFEDETYFQAVCAKIVASREQVESRLAQMGFEIVPSAANFLFVSHPAKSAAVLAAALREEGVIVRHFKQSRIDNYLRITIGTPEQNQRLLDTMTQILAA
ncbi:MAG: histidinol-phosphate transaminase [Pseudomonadales bacterium]